MDIRPEEEQTDAFIVILKPGQKVRVTFYESDGQIDVIQDKECNVIVDTGVWPSDTGQHGEIYRASAYTLAGFLAPGEKETSNG